MLILFQHRLHQIPRPMPYLLVNPAYVFAQQADAEQGDADEEEGDGEQGEQSFRFGADDQAANQQVNHEQRRQDGNRDADQNTNAGVNAGVTMPGSSLALTHFRWLLLVYNLSTLRFLSRFLLILPNGRHVQPHAYCLEYSSDGLEGWVSLG